MKNAPRRVATMNCRGFALEVPAASVPMVAVAQLVRVLDCDSRCRGFESPQPPQFRSATDGCRDDCTPTAQAPGGKKPVSRGARLRDYLQFGADSSVGRRWEERRVGKGG